MNSNEILGQITQLLHEATEVLATWLKRRLHKITDNWWEDCVLSSLTTGQYLIVQTKNITRLEQFDLAALLRITYKNWYAMCNNEYLTSAERDCIRKMQAVRNNWAHCSGICLARIPLLTTLIP